MILNISGKKYSVIILFCLLLIMGCQHSYANNSKRALIIGISQYPEHSGWKDIHCNNDVVLLRKTLIHYGLQESNIMELQDANATKEAILKNLHKIKSVAQIGDTIFVFFSGHGQLTIDHDKSTFLDETIIPYDACSQPSKYESELAEKHIKDIEYGKVIELIATKVGETGLVINVIDACHSDSMDKGLNENVHERGVHEIFGYESKFADSIKVLREERHDSVYRPNGASNIIYIAACQSYENNYEYCHVGKYYGRLIYAFCNVLPVITWDNTLDSINSPLIQSFNAITNRDNQHIAIRTTFKTVQLPSSTHYSEYGIEEILIGVLILFIFFHMGITFHCIRRFKYQTIEHNFVIKYLQLFFAIFDTKISLCAIFMIIIYLVYSLIKYLEWL